jgi:LCP family protein required for cell wall assembly
MQQTQLIPRVRSGPATAQPTSVLPPPGAPPVHALPRAAPTPPRSRRRRRRWWLLALLLVLAYPLVLAGLVLVGVDRVAAMPPEPRPAAGPGQTWLVVGSDSRSGLTPEQQAQLSTGATDSRLTDTILLLSTAPDGVATLISVPRDSLVDIPGYGENKVNAAYALGGPALLVQTLEAATGVRIDGYVEVGFDGFYRIVQGVGGVQVCPTIPLDDPRAGINLLPGCQVLDGAQALGYVRARYSDPRGDLGRVERQREFVAALAERAASPAVLLNPLRSVPLAAAVGAALTVDEGMGPVDLGRFGLAARSATGPGGQMLTVPVGGSADTRVGSVLLWDEALAPALWASLRDGTAVPPEVLAYP